MDFLTDADRMHRRQAQRRRRRTRRLAWVAAVVVSVGAVVVLLAVVDHSAPNTTTHARSRSVANRHGLARASRRVPSLPPIAAARPGVAHTIVRGPRTHQIALTFDDGFCAYCVARIVRVLERTGAHATIFPNGTYGPTTWGRNAIAIRRLVARGQLAIGNHTFLHRDAVTESAAALKDDLARNERWIQHTFGVTARPYFRPPYGAYDTNVLAVAGQLGYTRVVLWSGTLADSTPQSIPYVVHAIRYWARPGAIILAHANYPSTARALPRLLAIMRRRGLQPVTVPELLHGR